jgi:calcineurin-like phosphoesterase
VEEYAQMSDGLRILFVGDVVGSAGRRTLLAVLPRLRERTPIDFIVVNGENAAGGHGITSKIAREMFAAGVDVITLGNHTYRQQEVYRYLDDEDRILRRGVAGRQPLHEQLAAGLLRGRRRALRAA